MKKCNSVFYKYLSRFVNSKILEEEIERSYNEKMLNIKDDVYKPPKFYSINIKKREELKAVELLKIERRKSLKRGSIESFHDRIIILNKDVKFKTIIDFRQNNSNNVKSLAVKMWR